jgi:hypothetical protein
MNFAQLKRFIHDAVVRLSKPSVFDNGEFPRSREELLSLCDMLKEKANRLKSGTLIPERPVYQGPTNPGWSFTPSDALHALYSEQERAEERVVDQIEHGGGGVYLEYIQDELAKVKQKVAPIEKSEKEEYQKRLKAYRVAYEPYRHRLQSWRADAEQAQRRRDLEANRDELVHRTYRTVNKAFDPKHASDPKSMGTLPWEIAAPGERTDDRAIYRYYQEVVSRGRLTGFDQDRLDKLLALPREDWLKGSAGFYGYIILVFAHTPKVLMECPVRDNAIYVLNSGEDRLLKMNKQELIASGEAKRIFHVGDWYQRLKQELGLS